MAKRTANGGKSLHNRGTPPVVFAGGGKRPFCVFCLWWCNDGGRRTPDDGNRRKKKKSQIHLEYEDLTSFRVYGAVFFFFNYTKKS